MISLQVRGVDETIIHLRGIPYGARNVTTQAVAETLLGSQQSGLLYYPHERPGQSYVRTFNLRAEWKIRKILDGTGRLIANYIDYAPYVKGKTSQAWMHVGRWKTTTQDIAAKRQEMLGAAMVAVNIYLKSSGFK